MKLFVVVKDKGPVKRVVMFLTGREKKKYYAEPTDSEGYAELPVPAGQRYDITFLTLGRREITATVPRGGRTESIRQAAPALQA
jgi:hypothetical protein